MMLSMDAQIGELTEADIELRDGVIMPADQVDQRTAHIGFDP